MRQLHKTTNIHISRLGFDGNNFSQQHSNVIEHLVGHVFKHNKRDVQPVLLTFRFHLPQIAILAYPLPALPIKFIHGPIHNKIQRDIIPKIRAVVWVLYPTGDY